MQLEAGGCEFIWSLPTGFHVGLEQKLAGILTCPIYKFTAKAENTSARAAASTPSTVRKNCCSTSPNKPSPDPPRLSRAGGAFGLRAETQLSLEPKEDNIDNLDLAPPEGDAVPKTSHVPMLAKMAEMGMAKELVAVLVEFGGTKIPTNLRRYLEGPIIVHSSGGWRDVIPKWMFPQIVAERVEIVTGESPCRN